MDPHLSIEKTEIQGLYVVNPVSYKSDEDLIVETYNSQELLKNGLNMSFVQENQSMSVKGVLRGLHVQKNFPQGKLVIIIQEDFTVANYLSNFRNNRMGLPIIHAVGVKTWEWFDKHDGKWIYKIIWKERGTEGYIYDEYEIFDENFLL